MGVKQYSEAKRRKAFEKLEESQLMDMPKIAKQSEALFSANVLTVIQHNEVCKEQGKRIAEKLMKLYEFTPDEMGAFCKGLFEFASGITEIVTEKMKEGGNGKTEN